MNASKFLPSHKSVVGAITTSGQLLRTWCSSQTVHDGENDSNALFEPFSDYICNLIIVNFIIVSFPLLNFML